MSSAVKITRTDRTAASLRGLAAKSNDAGQVRRLLALALILEGYTRHEAARQAGMDRQTLRDWVHRYNAGGAGNLRSVRTGGHPASLTPAQMAELKTLTIKGPDPEKDGVVRWRCVDLRDEVGRRFTVTVSERTTGRWLRKLDLTRLQPRPFHPKRDLAAQEDFKKIPESDEGRSARQHIRRGQTGRNMLRRRSPGRAEGNPRLCLGAGWAVSPHGAG